MQVMVGKILATCAAAVLAATPGAANRLTFEVWTNPDAADAAFCSVALTDGWLTLVQVRGTGLPAPLPLRWRASPDEEDALTGALQAFIAGDLASVDPYASRLPPAPFLTITWMTTLDDHMATGLYIQRGTALPPVLADAAQALGLAAPCRLTAKAAE